MNETKKNIPEIESVYRDNKWDLKQYLTISEIYNKWAKLTDPSVLFYIPVYTEMQDDKIIKKPYMEPPENNETWLAGIVTAFNTQTEVIQFIKYQCQIHETLDIDNFTYWKTSLADLYNICNTMTQKYNPSVISRIRIDLYKISDDSILKYVDTIYDPITT